MKEKIKNSLQKLQNQPEDKKNRTVWMMAVFCMIIVLGIWFLSFRGLKKDVTSDFQRMSEFQDQFSKVGDIFEEFKKDSELIRSQITKEQVIVIANNYIKDNDLLTEDSLENIAISSVEKIDNIWFVNYLQLYNNIPFHESNIYLKISDENMMVIDSDINYVMDIDIETEPKINEEGLFNKIRIDLDDDNLEIINSELVVYNELHKEKKYFYLAWKINLRSLSFMKNYYYFINAENGDVISSIIL
ncbi:hypothetical protein K0B03_01290 [Patescibacteria group bacterium]|nr:hypothetical protein [Patescibacteria group bacterium]